MQAFSNLLPGSYRASIYTSSQSQMQAEAAMATFIVDTEGPVATMTRTPPPFVQSNAATFYFQSETSSSFQCRLLAKASSDVPTFQNCTSPRYAYLGNT